MKKYFIVLLLLTGCATHGQSIKISGDTRCSIISDKGTWDVPESPITANVEISQSPITIKCEPRTYRPANSYPNLVLITQEN